MKTGILTLLLAVGAFGFAFSTTPTTNTLEPTCFIAPVVQNVVCDDGGTPYDPSDDLIISFDIAITGDNDDINAFQTFSDNQGNTEISYNDPNTEPPVILSYIGPFPSGYPVIFTDTDDPLCTATIIVSCPFAQCQITPEASTDILCNDNGTPYDDSDDTFTFNITVNGENTEASASNTFNDDQGNSGIAYGSTVPYGPYPISGGTVMVNYTDVDAPADVGCTAVMMAIPPPTCSPATCEIIPEAATNIVCDDNGTPFDETDDTFTFDITVNGENTEVSASNTFNDDQSNTGIAYGTTVSYGPYPISGGTIMVNYTDVDAPADVGCTAVMMAIPPPTCSPAMCEIIPEAAANIECDDNGTPYDDSDDTFTFEITVIGSNTDPAASNTFNDDQGNIGIAYGTAQSYGPYPISGGSVTVAFTDADAPADVGCTATMMAASPPTCSPATCEITPNAADSVCNDNGTPFDASDDTFTFEVTVDGENTEVSATNTFNDDQGNSGIAYGTTLNYGPFPISGGPVVVTYTDVDAPADVSCTATAMGTPTDPCSDAECFITPEAPANILCDDNGTPFDNSDDTFIFEITVGGDNTDPTASDTFNDDQGNSDIAYGTTLTYGPFPISGGPVEITYTDVDAPASEDCTATMMAIPPMSCSIAECEISQVLVADLVCDDNGTPYDDSDDTFTFNVTVDGDNTDPTASDTFNDDQGNSGIAYGTTVPYGPFPISGGPVTVTYTDVDAPASEACTAMITATEPATCSPATCDITPEPAANIVCNNNGTPYDESDDTFTFDITVNGSDTGPGMTDIFNDDQGNSGTYGSTISYGPYPISGGPIVVTYTDADAPVDEACTAMMMAVPPPTCSPETCEIIPEPAVNIVCNNNGTTPDGSDDTFTFEITVNGNNTEASATNTFNDDQGNMGEPYGTTLTYGPFPISGGPIIVTYTDADAPADVACTAMMMAVPPETCSGECNITPQSPNTNCDDNGTPDDGSDDTYTFVIVVDGENSLPGASNTFDDDQGNTGIAYGTALTYGPYPIGTAVTVTYTDADMPVECNATVTATSPAICSLNNVPTVGEWGLIILGLLLSITAVVGIRQRKEEEAYG